MDRKYIIVDYVGNSSGIALENLFLLVDDEQIGGDFLPTGGYVGTAQDLANSVPIKAEIVTNETTDKVPTIASLVSYLKQGWDAIIPAKTTAIADSDKVIFFNTADGNKTKTRTWAQLVSNLAELFQSKPIQSALTYAATINLDFNSDTIRTITLTGDLTLGTPTNIAVGKEKILIVKASGAARTVTISFGISTSPAIVPLPAGKTAFISFYCQSTNASDILWSYALQTN